MGGSTGGSSKTQQWSSTNSTVTPYEKYQPGLDQIYNQLYGKANEAPLTGAENTAIAGIGQNSNQFAPQINQLANDLFKGGTDRTGMVQGSYDTLKGSLAPYTTMDTNPYSNEAFTKATNFMTDDIMNRVRSQYAASGYSPTGVGDYGKSVGEGVARGIAPAWAQANNDLENRKLGAIGGLYSAGNTSAGILGGLDQTAIDNRIKGVGASEAASIADESQYRKMLEAEALRRGIPMQNLAQVSSLMVPMAQLGRQVTGTSSSVGNTQNEAGLVDYMKLFSGGASSPVSGMANAGSALLGFLSDRNEKTDIKKVGKDNETGLDLYSYRYKGDPKTYPKVVGPMAQDIEKKFPGSTREINGKLAVKPEAAGLLGAI